MFIPLIKLISIPFSTIKSVKTFCGKRVYLIFQFHLVRLKDLFSLFNTLHSCIFQFHLVRLKACLLKFHQNTSVISIPFSTIKSLVEVKDARIELLFQFHLVRLKVPLSPESIASPTYFNSI